MAGLSIGFRSQMAVLTVPLLLWVVIAAGARPPAGDRGRGGGRRAWAIPLVWFSGGPGGYLQALGSQAGEDFSGVVMLWTHPTPRVAVVCRPAHVRAAVGLAGARRRGAGRWRPPARC